MSHDQRVGESLNPLHDLFFVVVVGPLEVMIERQFKAAAKHHCRTRFADFLSFLADSPERPPAVPGR